LLEVVLEFVALAVELEGGFVEMDEILKRAIDIEVFGICCLD
jgi:hypothetical protein